MPSRMIDYDALWASEKLSRCPECLPVRKRADEMLPTYRPVPDGRLVEEHYVKKLYDACSLLRHVHFANDPRLVLYVLCVTRHALEPLRDAANEQAMDRSVAAERNGG
jgi:hypothetical protein